MTLSASELYIMEKLNCGSADLCMLDNLYSTLGEACVDTEEIVKEADDLNYLLDTLYRTITDAVAYEVEEIANTEEGVQVSVKENGEIKEFKYLLMTDSIREQLLKKVEEMQDTYPFCNYLDTHFQNDLDQTVDWEASVRSNAEDLIQYWFESEEIEATDEDFGEL
jgi:hypothetical protein